MARRVRVGLSLTRPCCRPRPQSASNLANEAVVQAKAMGLRTCFTEHSLFRLGTPDGINLTKAFRFAACSLDHAFCVSHACRANFLRRVRCPPRAVTVVPNAIFADQFAPAPARRGTGVVVVVMSRMVRRKGTELLARVIPRVCRACPEVSFLVGGDGDLRVLLDEAVERHRVRGRRPFPPPSGGPPPRTHPHPTPQLHDRVELLGAVPHTGVRDVLVRGHLFLNCSLTEAFCIAILEAACCGLRVVSTNVGGVPEVLPPHLMECVDPGACAVAGGEGRGNGGGLRRPLPALPCAQTWRAWSTPCAAPRKGPAPWTRGQSTRR